ncbi:hypothetical protein FRC09_010694 [Ceratobasidium sp. 395]|nr:hypothetical protein FRC09_010694 [Ceratobasidium sp. 395]
MASNTLLQGKKVVILGGSSGIGKGVAKAAMENGASVVIASSNQSKVDTAVKLLKSVVEEKSGVTVSGQAFDIKDFAALTSFLTKEAPFDHLVITSGDSIGPLIAKGIAADVDIREQLKSTMDVRYWAVLNAANHIHKHGLLRPGGSLTMTLGILQARPLPGFGYLLGTAGAIETATRSLALDLKPIRVNSISAGLVDTEMTQEYPPEMRDQIFKTHIEKLPVGHVGTPEEVAEAYIFAMKCQYLTGQIITVDGGGVLV